MAAIRIDIVTRMQDLAAQMREVNARIAADRSAIAVSPLACAARTAWTYSQCALAQASAGLLPIGTIDAIATPDGACGSGRLQALRLSTLQAAERRLRPPPLSHFCGVPA